MRFALILALLFALPASALETVWGTTPGGGANTLVDSDGDDLFDYVFVQGDYNGDGSVTNDDIQDAINALTDTDSPRTVRVAAGIYDGSGVPDGNVALVSLPANTALKCDPGAVIKGPTAATLATKTTSTRIITNSAVVDPTDLTAIGDDAEDTGIVIDGCELYYDLGSSYDSSTWTGNIDHFGIYLERATRGVLTNNRISKTPHTCMYLRSISDAFATGNYFGDGCGNGNDTDAGGVQRPALYLFASEGVDVENVLVANNTCIESGGDCFYTRAEFSCTGTDDGDEDGNLCRLDNATTGGATNCTTTNGTCAASYIRGVLFEGNVATGAENACYRMGSARDSSISNNICNGGTFGIELGGITDGEGVCDTANEISDDANCFNSVVGNHVSGTTNNAIIVQGGNQDTVISGNFVSNIAASCSRIFPPANRVEFSNNSFHNCDLDGSASQNFTVLEVSSAAATAEQSDVTDLTFSNNNASKIGIDASDRIRGSLVLTNYVVDNFKIFNNTIEQTTAAAFAQICLRFLTLPSSAYIRDNFCGDNDEQVPESDAMSDALLRGSVIVQEGDPTALFTGDTCGETGAIWRDSTAATGASYECRNGVWVAM